MHGRVPQTTGPTATSSARPSNPRRSSTKPSGTLALAGLRVLYERRQPDWRPGRLFAMYVLGYGLGRVWVEALRIDDATRIAGVRVNIWVSLDAVAAASGALAALRRRPSGSELPEHRKTS